MPGEGLITVSVPGLGAAVELVDFAACMASGGDVLSCSPIGTLIDLFSSLFAGVPRMLKTEEAVARLSQSTLPQFQQLARNLGIWVKNGVPLSTGDPGLRAQLEGWIHGTIYDSGLGLRVTPQGYDQFAAVDTTLWRVLASQFAYSGRALDTLVNNFRAVNRVIDQGGGDGQSGGGNGGKPPPPPAPPPWPFGPIPQPCIATPIADGDEVTDGFTCIAENGAMIAYAIWQLYQAAKDLVPPSAPAPPTQPPEPPGEPPPAPENCCDEIVAALTAIVDALNRLTIAPGPVSGPPPPDLAPVVDAISTLTATVQRFEKCVCDSLGRIADANDAADALGAAVAAHWATLFPGDPGTTQLVLS